MILFGTTKHLGFFWTWSSKGLWDGPPFRENFSRKSHLSDENLTGTFGSMRT